MALTGYGSVWNEATFENFKEYYKHLWAAARGKGELTPEDWGRFSRQKSAFLCYGLGFMVFYEGIANGISAAFRALDEEKERKKAEEIRKTNPNYKSMYELAYPDGMKWYDYLMRGNSLGQQSKIFLGRYAMEQKCISDMVSSSVRYQSTSLTKRVNLKFLVHL